MLSEGNDAKASGSNDARATDMHAELRLWLERHGLAVHVCFLQKLGVRTMAELLTAAASAPFNEKLEELKIVQRKKLERELKDLMLPPSARTDSRADSNYARPECTAGKSTSVADDINHQMFVDATPPHLLEAAKDAKFAADTITEYQKLDNDETKDAEGRNRPLQDLRRALDATRKGLESLMDLEESSPSMGPKDEDVQVIHGEATCTSVQNRIKVLRRKCLLLERGIQQHRRCSERTEHDEPGGTNGHFLGRKAFKKKEQRRRSRFRLM
jgi:hypothetical protein